MGKTAAYIRVSTEEQQAQGTQENQTNAINAFCLSRGRQVHEWFQEQESTLNPERPEFKRLMEKVESGDVSTVIVASLDRFSRDQIETLQAIELFKKQKASFHAIRDNINISNGEADLSTEMVISVMSLFAKNERETIRQRTMAGKNRKKTSGKWVVGMPPLGYQLDKQTKVLQVNPKEAEIVREIFKLRLDGLGILKIMKHLSSTQPGLFEKRHEFKSPRYCKVSHKQKKSGYCRIRHYHPEFQVCADCVEENAAVDITGSLWSHTSVRKILTDRVYLGQIKAGGEWIDAQHESLIDSAQFEQVQETLKKERHHPYQNYLHNILTGLVYCSCGRRMHVVYNQPNVRKDMHKPTKIYWSFRCPNRVDGGQCQQRNLPVKHVRKAVFDIMDKILQSDETSGIIHEAYKKVLDNHNGKESDITGLKKELQKVTKELANLSNGYAQALAAGLKEDLLKPIIVKMSGAEQRRETLTSKIKFAELRTDATKKRLASVTPEDLLRQVHILWWALSVPQFDQTRGAAESPFRSSGKFLKAAEEVGRIIRAFILRVDVKGDEIVPVLRFDLSLLERPLDELLQILLRIHQLGKTTEEIVTEEDSAASCSLG